MPGKFPKNFAFLIAFLLLLLLAGYLFLADIVPKQSPLPIREETPNTAEATPAPEEDIGNWREYHDPKLGFTVRIPQTWQAQAIDQTPYEVRFTDGRSSYQLSVRAYATSKLDEIVKLLQKKTMRGLFPPTENTTTMLMNDTEAPTFLNYTSPHGDASASSAAVAHEDTVFVLEYIRPISATEHEGLFGAWLRSFSI